MSVSYKKLWKLLIDKDMKKKTCVKRRYQPSISYQDGTEWACHHGDTHEIFCGAGLQD